MRESEVFDWLKSVIAYAEKEHYAGWDPYDLPSNPLYARAGASRLGPFLEKAVFKCPRFARRLLFIKKHRFPKAMALFGYSYIVLWKYSGDGAFFKKASECIAWLCGNVFELNGIYGWGLPVAWKKGNIAVKPNKLPFVVVTAVAVDALLSFQEHTSGQCGVDGLSNSILSIFNNIQAGLESGNASKKSHAQRFYTYTPIDGFAIHNANLLAALTLARLRQKKGLEPFSEEIKEAIRFTTSRQSPDGSWLYGDPETCGAFNYIDSIHTGFVLRSLSRLNQLTQGNNLEESLERGLKFYMERLQDPVYGPKYRHDRIFPIDIHACAEEIILFCKLKNKIKNCREMVEKRLEFIQRHFWDKGGYFYYRMNENGNACKLPCMRWGQAWMARALSAILETGIFR